MKLILCRSCHDIVRLFEGDWRACRCGASQGRYLEDGQHAQYRGDAIPLGFLNSTLATAIRDRPEGPGDGARFVAFVVPHQSATFKKVGH